MASQTLLPDPNCLTLDSLSLRDGDIIFAVRTIRPTSACPLCKGNTDRVHSRYRRKLLDLPWQGNAVRIEMTARKFFCDNRDCQRRIFAEPIATVAQRYARKTARLADVLRELTYLAGGEAAARIARAFGLLVSPDALLRHLKRAAVATTATPRVLGVDDFAFRRGRRYGTVLVDLERRCPVDLLPNREPETVAAWLRNHPGIKVISRDRGACYVEGATKGAPDAVQVADRWHLVKNLGDALERLLTRQHKLLREAAKDKAALSSPKPDLPTPKPNPLSPAQQHGSQCRRERRVHRYEEVQHLLADGVSSRQIAYRLGMFRNTVSRLAHCEQFPEAAPRPPRRGKLTNYAAHLKRRWPLTTSGCNRKAVMMQHACIPRLSVWATVGA